MRSLHFPGGREYIREILSVIFCFAVLLTGCGYRSVYTPNEMREIIEMRSMMDEDREQREGFYLKIESALNSVQKAQENDQLVSKELLDDVLSHLRRLEDEIEKSKTLLDVHTFTLDRMGQRMGLGSSSVQPGQHENNPPDELEEGQMVEPAPFGQSALDRTLSIAHNAYNLGDFSDAREKFEISLELEPGADQKIDILFWLGDTCEQQGELQDARKHYSDLIKSNAQHVKAWVSFERIANIEKKQGNLDSALNMLSTIVKEHPGYPDAERVRAAIIEIKLEKRNLSLEEKLPGVEIPVPPPG